MKKIFGNWKVQVAFIVTGVFVGLLVTAQFKSAIPASSYPLDEFHAQRELIKGFNDDQALLKSKILNLRRQIDEKQKQSSIAVQRNNLETLSELKKEIGLESVKGDGIELVVDDGLFARRNFAKVADQSLVNAADLRDIANILFSAQAQAITINDQRIIATSPIAAVGNTIMVNNFNVLPPFTISAIGDYDFFIQRLSNTKVLQDLQKRIKLQKIRLNYRMKKNMVAPVYSGDFRLKHIKETLN